MRRILFTTTHRVGGYYDYWAANTRSRWLRLAWRRKRSLGLRFLQQNLPGIDILEYPTRREFEHRVESGRYDTLGISFYLDDTDRALAMSRTAREAGIAEIWGGNYGVLTPGIPEHFDKVFRGYAEELLAEELGVATGPLEHPPIVVNVETAFGVGLIPIGILLTTRGCNVGCSFCQTPAFCPTVTPIPLDSIDRVLRHYARCGIREIQILDESFGLLREHADEVISLLGKYGLYWYPMTRADILDKRLEEWHERGLLGAFVALENLSQRHLDTVGKHLRVETALDLVRRMDELDLFITGYYMLGFADETRASILLDMEQLADLELDLYQLCVVTPLPETALDTEIRNRYGAPSLDCAQYDMKHLVWKHPHIAAAEMPDLLSQCFRTVHTPRSLVKTLTKAKRRYVADRGVSGAVSYALTNLMRANRPR